MTKLTVFLYSLQFVSLYLKLHLPPSVTKTLDVQIN